MVRVTNRFADGSFVGTIRDGESIPVRVSAEVSFSRDNDGTWIAYGRKGHDEAGDSLSIIEPVACAAFDALFELLCDPVEFKARSIGERTPEPGAAR